MAANEKLGSLGKALRDVLKAKESGGAKQPINEEDTRGAAQPAEPQEGRPRKNPKFRRGKGAKRQLVMGCDVGTSCSKVVIRDVGLEKAFPACFFPNRAGIHRYLLPTALWELEDKELSLAPSEGIAPFMLFKIRLIDLCSQEGSTVESVLDSEYAARYIAYVALVVRAVRDRFLENHREEYKGAQLVWEVNVGVPSRSAHGTLMADVFRTLAQAAVTLAWGDTDIRIKVAADAAIEQYFGDLDEKDRPSVEIHPEVIAQVQGYRLSSRVIEGLHALVDIGAATVDLCTFVYHENDDEPLFSLLTAEVHPLGCEHVQNSRIAEIDKCLRSSLKAAERGAQPLPTIDDAMRCVSGPMKEVDRKMTNELGKVFVQTLKETQTRRDPNSPMWREGLRVFLCGGGRGFESYAARMREIIEGKHGVSIPLTSQELQCPDDLHFSDKDASGYERLAVAYGLSIFSLDFGEVTPPEKISDIERFVNRAAPRIEYASKEFV